jgi:LemA protein
MLALEIIGGIIILIILFVIVTYNNLVKYRLQADDAWSQIDVQLKRRHDLIPNLVETVKGVMKFEKDTLTQIVQARASAVNASNIPDRIKAENDLSSGMSRLMAVWENYPDLKSSKNAQQLQEELVSTENKIAYARGFYNDIVANYNAQLQQFPSNMVASNFHFQLKEFLKVPDQEKEAPEVKF